MMEKSKSLSKLAVAVVAGVAFGAMPPAQAQYVPGTNNFDMSKLWSLSLDARGFYDDNFMTEAKSFPVNSPAGGVAFAHPQATWGTEITPAVAVNHSAEDSLVTASYIFDDRWNENRSTTDLTHQFNGLFEHEFGKNFKLSLSESFASAQEPTVIDPGIVTTPFWIAGNNMRNTGQIDFTAAISTRFALHLGYANTVYAYQQVDRSVIGFPFIGYYSGYLATPSFSDLLDRMEQLATLDLQWKATPETTGILGYRYGHTDYTSPGYILYPYGPGTPYPPPGLPQNSSFPGDRSDVRNADSDFGFAGVDESFTPKIVGSIRAGAEYVDYYNAGTSRVSPYVDAKITYRYSAIDAIELGAQHIHHATDVVGAPGGTPVLDAETTAVFLSEKHAFSKKFTASVTGRAQDSTYVGGGAGYDGKRQDFIVIEVNFAYHFNSWLLAETGYNYSRLTSDLQYREYTRNFGFFGLQAAWGP